MSKVDLHIHSTVSDGKFSPAEIVRKAAAAGLTTISLTDHDAVNGIPEALEEAKNFPGLRVIPGVEISTDVALGEIHILGYFIDIANRAFEERLKKMRDSRFERARKMVAKLAGLGMPIEWNRVQELATGNTIGRPHIAQVLLEKGHVSEFKEAFDRYIGRDGPAYVERDKMTPAEAVRLIIESGGLPVFAHPLTFPGYERMTGELTKAGLTGIEVYYKYATPGDINDVLLLSRKYDLIPTGGSDFHGIDDKEVQLGSVKVPEYSAERLFELAKKRGLKGINV